MLGSTPAVLGAVLAGGTLAGAAVATLIGRDGRLEAFADRADLIRHLQGAVLMGLGAPLAGGCTVGQGIAGLAGLQLDAASALVGMVLGARLGLHHLETGRLLPWRSPR